MPYDMVHFSTMLRDRRRRDAYVAALTRTVGPDSVVLDLGSGPGFFAAVAARLGARRVFAVDLLEAVDAVPLLARANGLEERIQAFRGDIRTIELPEAPNVVIADLRGPLPLHTSGLSVVADVREDVMAPAGVWLQQRDDLRAALAYVDRAELETAWDEPGLDFDALRRHALSVPRRVQLEADQIVTTSGVWTSIDYADADNLRSRKRRGSTTLRAIADGPANTIALWFDATLIEGISYDSAPGDSYTTYGQITLPLLEPLSLLEGDEVNVELSFDRLDAGDVWRWQVSAGDERRNGNSLDGIPIAPHALLV